MSHPLGIFPIRNNPDLSNPVEIGGMLMVEDMALLVIKWVPMFPKQVSFKKEVGVRLMSELITQNLTEPFIIC